MPKVLISDKLSPLAVDIFKDRGIETVYAPDLGKDKDALLEAVADVDGLAIRSATKVTEKVLDAAKKLKVIGRAGIGVDNIDVRAASRTGVIVMNTPFGNSITTAEHAVAMMFAVSRQIAAADASTQAGKWEKNRFMGRELTGKTLGVIGCGNIGSIVAARGIGLKLKVIAFDPFLTAERAREMGVEKVDVDELLRRADIVTLHTPLTEATKNIVSREAIATMKPGAMVINCARGGLIDEIALREALDEGRLGGAGIDVFSSEPAHENVLFGAKNLVCTPHLGAATTEAQENVALQVAEQMAEYLLRGAVSNALNMPSITAEEAPLLTPWVTLAERLGGFAGQLTETGIVSVRIEYEGDVADMNLKALTAAAVTGLMRPLLQDVNMVSAPTIARDRGIKVEEVRRDAGGAYENYIRLTVTTERQERSVAGTVFSDGKPRIIQVKGINLEADFAPNLIYVTNEDKPGLIGRLGTLLGEAGVNIANFKLGRKEEGGEAICIVEVDGAPDAALMPRIEALPQVRQAKSLRFH
ncbi:MAG: phosphoglycerate dehydrogenase [Pseudomonadota bacterium]